MRRRLAALDDAVLPRAAARLHRLADRAAAARARARAAVRGDLAPSPATTGPDDPGPLARLDARLARRGPLAVLRAMPGAGAALAAAVLLAGGVALVSGAAGRQPGPVLEPAARPFPESSFPAGGSPAAPGRGALPDAVPPTVLGPAEGVGADDHLAAAREELARLTVEAPAAPVPALVHLAAPLPPAELAALAAGVSPLRAVVRVPVPGAQTSVATVPAVRLPDDALAAFAERAARLRSGADADEAAAGLRAPEDPAAGVLREAARIARLEADALATGPACACVAGLLVVGPPAKLQALAARDEVVGVDPAPADVPPEQLTLRPLLPAAEGTLP